MSTRQDPVPGPNHETAPARGIAQVPVPTTAPRATDASPEGVQGPPARVDPERGIPEATVARLPVYLRALAALAERGVLTVSSDELAAAAGVGSAKLRKDLSHLGSYGVRGVGYDVSPLVAHISRQLGLTQEWRVVIVGVGNLGRALASYDGLAERGMGVAALFDADPAVVGQTVADMVVRPMDDLPAVVRRDAVAIGVLATPGPAAQEACDALVAAGVTSVLTFAPAVLSVPRGVDVRKVDLASELQILAFHEQRKAGDAVRAVVAPDPTRVHDVRVVVDGTAASAELPHERPAGHAAERHGARRHLVVGR